MEPLAALNGEPSPGSVFTTSDQGRGDDERHSQDRRSTWMIQAVAQAVALAETGIAAGGEPSPPAHACRPRQQTYVHVERLHICKPRRGIFTPRWHQTGGPRQQRQPKEEAAVFLDTS